MAAPTEDRRPRGGGIGAEIGAGSSFACRPLGNPSPSRRKAVCQYDAFAGDCAEAEREGVEHFPLYAWTKATIEDPAKKAKYERSFTLYIDGEQVYPKAQADALAAELRPLVGAGLIADVDQDDTNPANNPQPPAPDLAEPAAPELLQPVSGYCIYDEHLERKGEGLHHIKLYHADCAKAVADYAARATR